MWILFSWIRQYQFKLFYWRILCHLSKSFFHTFSLNLYCVSHCLTWTYVHIQVYDALGVVVEEVGESFYNPFIPATIKRLQDVSCFSVLHHALSFVIASCYIVHGLTCSRWHPVKNTFYLIRILCQLAVLPNVNAANNVVLVYTLNVLNPTPYIFVHCIHSNLKSH